MWEKPLALAKTIVVPQASQRWIPLSAIHYTLATFLEGCPVSPLKQFTKTNCNYSAPRQGEPINCANTEMSGGHFRSHFLKKP
jgi:hypothetical protein